MRVLILFNDYLQAGGERQSVASEVRALTSAGVEVRLHRIDNSTLDAMGRFGKARSVVGTSDVLNQLRGAISSFKPDLVHAENLFPQLGGAAIRVLSHQNLPWVRTLRNYRKGCLAGTFELSGRSCTLCSSSLLALPGIRHKCYKSGRMESTAASVSRILDLRAEAQYPPLAYFSVSDFVARRISADTLPEVPTITVYNAIERPLDVQILPPIERDFDICFVGRLEDEKGLARAVELARTDRYRWAFVGGGSLRPVVEELAEGSVGRVNYLGPLTYDRTMSVMSRSKVAVVPSIWDEPFGRVAVEAMAVGAVPLVANRGGLPEAVRGLPIDAVVQAPNDDAWRKKCREVLDLDSVALSALSNAAIEVWKTNFAEQTLGSTLKRHYETLLSQRAAVLRNG